MSFPKIVIISIDENPEMRDSPPYEAKNLSCKEKIDAESVWGYGEYYPPSRP